MQSILFRLNGNDFLKGLVMAVISGFALPILVAFQTPNFSLATVNWQSLFTIAITGALSGFASYLIKNFFSDQNGKVLGKIG